MLPTFFKPRLYSFLSLVVLVTALLFIYFDIHQIPFYLDDFSSIVNNPTLQQPIDFSQIWISFKARMVTYSGFAIQLTLFGKEPAFFHIVGFALHLCVGLFLFLFISLLSKPQFYKYKYNFVFAISITSIFLLHPLNSQAVIYIAQQAVLWVTLFYLSTLSSYILWRRESNSVRKLFWLGLCLLSICFALLSKQTAATIPLGILLIEWLFFGAYLRRLVFVGVGLFVIALLYVCISMNWQWHNIVNYVDSISRETQYISRMKYFASQNSILWHYMQQYFTLQGFRLEYDFNLVKSWQFTQWVSLCSHGVLLILALLSKRFSPLITFGILFFYLTHLIESSFFPIRDLAFEHRTYLPNIGLTIALVASIFTLFKEVNIHMSKSVKVGMSVTIFSISLLSLFFIISSSHKRVQQWADPLVFYKNEITLSPRSPRATGEYATALVKSGNCPLAIGYFNHAIALYKLRHESTLGIQPEMLINYIGCLRMLRVYAKAEHWELTLLEQVKEPIRRSMILGQRGLFYIEQKKFLLAKNSLSEAVTLNSTNYTLFMNLAISCVNLGDFTEGRKHLKKALVLKPNDQMAIRLLGKLDSMVIENK